MIRSHDYGRFVEDAVRSVAAQTRPADEIVIVDDGSSDDTLEIAMKLSLDHGNITVLTRQPARGPAASFNDGVSAAAGELIVALDADDRLSPTYLEDLARALTDPAIGFAYADEHMFGSVDRVRVAPRWDAREIARENYVNVSAMFRREVFDRTGGFRPDLDDLGLEDWEFWLHAVAKGFVGTPVNTCWLEYRRHPAGSRNSMTRVDVLRVHRKVRTLHPDAVRRRDLAAWVIRSLVRNARRVTR
ncbi:MAG: glycosyltransferase family A protein [Chloroflexota bacterium]